MVVVSIIGEVNRKCVSGKTSRCINGQGQKDALEVTGPASSEPMTSFPSIPIEKIKYAFFYKKGRIDVQSKVDQSPRQKRQSTPKWGGDAFFT